MWQSRSNRPLSSTFWLQRAAHNSLSVISFIFTSLSGKSPFFERSHSHHPLDKSEPGGSARAGSCQPECSRHKELCVRPRGELKISEIIPKFTSRALCGSSRLAQNENPERPVDKSRSPPSEWQGQGSFPGEEKGKKREGRIPWAASARSGGDGAVTASRGGSSVRGQGCSTWLSLTPAYPSFKPSSGPPDPFRGSALITAQPITLMMMPRGPLRAVTFFLSVALPIPQRAGDNCNFLGCSETHKVYG